MYSQILRNASFGLALSCHIAVTRIRFRVNSHEHAGHAGAHTHTHIGRHALLIHALTHIHAHSYAQPCMHWPASSFASPAPCLGFRTSGTHMFASHDERANRGSALPMFSHVRFGRLSLNSCRASAELLTAWTSCNTAKQGRGDRALPLRPGHQAV